MSLIRALREQWIAWRNARLQDPAFQAFCAGLPITRGVSRAYAARIFDLVAGFVYSQALLGLVRANVLTRLATGPASAETLAAQADVPAAAFERLLRAGVALRLIEPLGDGRYALGADGAALLGQPGMLDMIAHHAILYDDLADPLQLLRTSAGEGLSGYWAYAKEGGAPVLTEEQAARYSALMAATAPGVAAEVLASVSFRGVREVLDIGGGEGVFLSAVGKRWPRVRLRLMDLPAVMPRAQARLAPFGERVAFSPGNFLTDSPPAGADLITLVRVLHDQDEAGAMRLLRAAHAAAPKGGRLLIAEPMSAAPAPDRVSDAYFGLYFLAMGRGEARTPAVISAMAQEAGWRAPREVRTRHPALLRVLIADA